MKNTFMVIPLFFLCCFAVGCLQRGEVAEEPVADVEADIQAIKDAIVEVEAAVNAGDTDRAMVHLADDAVLIRPNEPALIGKEAIRGSVQQEFDEVTLQDVYTVKSIKVSGDLAVAHFLWSTTFKFIANGKVDETNGNWIMVFGKQSDETWKIIYSIWSDEGLVIPTQTE
jgi:ketosteroid isomerase-like protein